GPGRRVFDIKLQNRVVQSSFDVMKMAHTTNQAIIEVFRVVPVKGNLIIELAPRSKISDIDQAPLINFVEVIREDSGNHYAGERGSK
ncbi:MAG: hypothetical protein HQ582_12195, partial [Planctomycetes bacterium]|nr:hypothetical protein [Planctomycetota bacterium]